MEAASVGRPGRSGRERPARRGDGRAPRPGAAARGQPVLALPRRRARRLPARRWRSTCADWTRSIRPPRAPGCASWSSTRRWPSAAPARTSSRTRRSTSTPSSAALREVEDAVAGGERVERSVEALRALKPDEAKALMLKAQGLSYQEIGRRFGWTYTKVNRSITEGRGGSWTCSGGSRTARRASATPTRSPRWRPGRRRAPSSSRCGRTCATARPAGRACASCACSRGRRIAALIPGLPWLARRLGHACARVPADVQYAAATGSGGRLGPAVALLGVCLGGAGAAVCATGGSLPVAPPLIAHAARHRRAAPRAPAAATPPPAQRHTRVRAIAVIADRRPPRPPRPTATPAPARRAPVGRRIASTTARRAASSGSRARRRPRRRRPCRRWRGAASVAAAPAPARHASSGAAGSEFGFEHGG